jgi:hypothetical protein
MPLSTDRQAEERKMKRMRENNVWLKKAWLRNVRIALEAKPHYFGR